jgi:predicted flap endonuclease-1-like 5' DNA nuclease
MKSDRRAQAEAIVERRAAWAFACGLLPVPLIDVAALALIQARMVEELAALYELPSTRVRAEAYVSALVGSYASTMLGLGQTRYGLAAVRLLGAASMSVSGASITYLLGRIFIREFESGRTFMDFDPASVEAISARETDVGEPAALPSDAEASASAPASAPAPAPAPAPAGPDDLALVNGIGPKIAELLAARGITTFEDLAATPVDALKAILQSAGTRFAVHDPTSWPEQAKAALAGRNLDSRAARTR